MKVVVFDLNKGGFIGVKSDGTAHVFTDKRFRNDLSKAALFCEEDLERLGIGPDSEADYLKIPISMQMQEMLPFDFEEVGHSVTAAEQENPKDRETAMNGDFLVMTSYGFHMEEYDDDDHTSIPQIRSFDMSEATLYSRESLKRCKTEWITKRTRYLDNVIIPVSKAQQVKLKALPDYSPETNPYGFFMEPLGNLKIAG